MMGMERVRSTVVCRKGSGIEDSWKTRPPFPLGGEGEGGSRTPSQEVSDREKRGEGRAGFVKFGKSCSEGLFPGSGGETGGRLGERTEVMVEPEVPDRHLSDFSIGRSHRGECDSDPSISFVGIGAGFQLGDPLVEGSEPLEGVLLGHFQHPAISTTTGRGGL
jgi:hypothetical protein